MVLSEYVSDSEGTKDTSNDEQEVLVLKCPHCPKDFVEIQSLQNHQQSEHNSQEIKYTCPKCQATFVSASQFEKHLSYHTPAAQICKLCGKTFANVYRLQRHMISHDESNDLRRFKCSECGKAFKFKHHLKEHVRIHSGEKPFECSNCGKRFSHSGSYSSHMTSKKCWVVNMKVGGKMAEKSPEKDNMRPMILPYNAENGGMTYHNGAPFVPYSTAAGQAQLMAQLNRVHRFLPYPSSYPGSGLMTTINPILPGVAPLRPNLLFPGATPAPTAEEKDRPASSPADKVEMDENKNIQSLKSNMKEDTEEEKQAEGDMDEVQKVLERVGATVNQQQQNKEDKTTISKLADKIAENLSGKSQKGQEISKGISSILNKTGFKEDGSTTMKCRYCADRFQSPVELHQHERYLCQKNGDINLTPTKTKEQQPIMLPLSMIKSESPGSICTDKTSDDEGEVGDENMPLGAANFKPYRARSMFTEEQLRVLKAQYSVNTRPSKFDLQRIADEIGYPKRTVRVWFQNKRAQDRRKDKEAATSMAIMSQGLITSGRSDLLATSLSKSQIFSKAMHVHTGSAPVSPSYPIYSPKPRVNGHVMPSAGQTGYTAHTPANLAYTMQMDEPLDLSTKTKSPPVQAHTNKPFTRPPTQEETQTATTNGEILDLSTGKKEDGTEEQDKQERLRSLGLGKTIPKPPSLNGLSHLIPPGEDDKSPGNIIPLLVSSEKRGLLGSLDDSFISTPTFAGAFSGFGPFSSTPSRASAPPGLMSLGSPTPLDIPRSPSQASSTSPHGGSLHSSFASSPSLDDSLLGAKIKRARKKTWRQMEFEDVEMDIDESLIIDEDQLAHKKRKSWKHHKVDNLTNGEEVGMYACDQCDKMFNKQSSLARHKYEHSGARPFQCTICTKAFKHKHHLTEHTRLHSGEKPFECQKCGKRFSHSGSFSQHMNHRYKYCKPLKLELERHQAENCVA